MAPHLVDRRFGIVWLMLGVTGVRANRDNVSAEVFEVLSGIPSLDSLSVDIRAMIQGVYSSFSISALPL